MVYTVGPKGQVVIAKELRDKLGVEPGWWAVQRLVDDHIEIHFLPPEHDRSLFGALKEYVNEPLPPERWNEVREAAWAEAIREKGYFRPGE
jgi:bifunctional DNA-binding transcriptional regulator/antitoxin component of YhaV-PrlF toxin-antitoxin module